MPSLQGAVPGVPGIVRKTVSDFPPGATVRIRLVCCSAIIIVPLDSTTRPSGPAIPVKILVTEPSVFSRLIVPL